MPNARFIARTKTKKLRAEIWLNDIPTILLLPDQADEPVGVPLNDNVVAGTNRLRVVVHAGPLASRSTETWANRPEAAAYNGDATLEVFLAEFQENQPVHKEGPVPIDTIDWQGAAAPIPESIEREFTAAGFGRWAWQNAQPLGALEGETRDGATAYLTRLHGMLTSGDYIAFLEESRTKIDEYARAYGIAPGPLRSSLLDAIISEGGRLTLLPLNPAEIDLRLVADGRMIECLRTDRTHALEYTGPNDQAFFLPVMIGKVNGEWRMLR